MAIDYTDVLWNIADSLVESNRLKEKEVEVLEGISTSLTSLDNSGVSIHTSGNGLRIREF